MKNIRLSKTSLILFFILAVILSGCEQQKSRNTSSTSNLQKSSINSETIYKENDESETLKETAPIQVQDLEVHFGDDGEAFLMHLYDNNTAMAIAKHIGTTNWRLPIYHYDDYENYEVMQYYDIPERYETPSNPENITSEKAGEVFYSHPNRIVLFYGDAEVTGEYTKIGYFDATDEFKSAVKDNPVLEGWGNKIILINNTN